MCDEVLKAVDPNCGVESSQMRHFSESVARNGGDFSVSFWYRLFDEKSVLNGRFLPHIAFYSSRINLPPIAFYSSSRSRGGPGLALKIPKTMVFIFAFLHRPIACSRP